MADDIPTNDETLKAIAARIRYCAELIASGRSDMARHLLERIAPLLPTPDDRHMRAARGH